MGTVSDKLTYLNTTKQNIKTAINNAGANITNDTFRSYATSLNTRITKMHTDYDTALSYLPMDTKTNTSISITNAVDLSTYNFKLSKLSTQDGTPTPSNPVEVSAIKTSVNVIISDGTNSRTITIPLGDNEICGIGDYKDELVVDKKGHCWLNKKIGKVILNGTETWTRQSPSHTNILNLYTPMTSWEALQEKTFVYCNYFKYDYNAGSNNDTTPNIVSPNLLGTNFLVDVSLSEFSNETSFTTWLTTHNVIVYYPLLTPTLIDLNYNVDLTLYEGTNTITNSETATMEITCVEDINTILATLTTPSSNASL